MGEGGGWGAGKGGLFLGIVWWSRYWDLAVDGRGGSEWSGGRWLGRGLARAVGKQRARVIGQARGADGMGPAARPPCRPPVSARLFSRMNLLPVTACPAARPCHSTANNTLCTPPPFPLLCALGQSCRASWPSPLPQDRPMQLQHMNALHAVLPPPAVLQGKLAFPLPQDRSMQLRIQHALYASAPPPSPSLPAVLQGKLAFPLPRDWPMQLLAAKDLGRVAAQALASPRDFAGVPPCVFSPHRRHAPVKLHS